MTEWTNWTDKQDAEVLDRVYRMRPDGTMSTANTVPYSDMVEHYVTKAPREGHERPKT